MIVSGGESLIDLIQQPEENESLPGAPAVGPRYPFYEAVPGGSPCNCAIATARMEADTGFLCPFSEDALGRLMRNRTAEQGVHILIDEPSTAPSALAAVSIDDKGQPTYQFYRIGTADRDIDSSKLVAALPDPVEIFHTGSLALVSEADAAHWQSCAEHVVARGGMLSLDPNVRPLFVENWETYRARLAGLFDLASVVKISDEDLANLGMPDDQENLEQYFLRDHSVALLVITRGTRGASLSTETGRGTIAPYIPDTIVDTVGAGDTFMGGLLSEIRVRNLRNGDELSELDAEDLESIGRFATVAAGLNCGRKGCDPPSREAVHKIVGALP